MAHEDSSKQGSAKAASLFAGKAWQQVLERDRLADGQFFYAVKSTGIYCKPSCASRRPERKNVKFYPTAADAEAAGFRACLRCEPGRVAPKADPQADAVARAAEFLREHRGKRLPLEEAAKVAGVSKFAVLRGFRRVLGVTPGEFLRAERRENFRERVAKKPAATITDAVYEAGFGSASRLYEDADATLGMTPTAMRAGGAGETIHWAVAETAVGTMVVGATERGLCAVLFAENDGDAAAALRERFPQAVLRRDDAGLRDAVAFVSAHLRETSDARTMPFHVRATAFQQRVWEALRAIPRGQTRTYAEVAAAIGAPKSVRAVGAACGANPLAVVVPCHRVVGARGELTGYRWGVERKRQLLAEEHAGVTGTPAAAAHSPE